MRCPVSILSLLACALIGACAATAANVAAATVTGVTVDRYPARVIVALDGDAGGVKAFALDGPLRLVIDLAGVGSARSVADGAGVVVRTRIGQFDPDTSRLVIELDRPMQLGPAAASDHRLVLAVIPIDAAGFAREVTRGRHPVKLHGTVPAVAQPAILETPPVARVATPPTGPASPVPGGIALDFDLPGNVMAGKATAPLDAAADAPLPDLPPPPVPRRGDRPLVVIDPGHGGKDAGTISVEGGAYEKNVVLAIARAAAAALRRSGKVRVVLTRDDDVFVPLPQRVAIARAAHADLFVSVHADSAPNSDARGASVYTLSDSASDVVAARLAARENKSDIIAGVNLGIDAPEVGDILIDLVQRSTMNVAVSFAETLQSSLTDAIGFRGEFHHFAGFRVLKAADVPSVLLETGYLSNPDDAHLLLSPAGQRRLGEGIARAIEAHFARQRAR